MLADSHGNLDGVVGRLATDRPNVVKLYGAYSFPFGTQVGLFFYGGSGTPISTYVNTPNHDSDVRLRPRRHGPDAGADAHRSAGLARVPDDAIDRGSVSS